ncbi:MAG: response regulator transcription factor [Gemmatimonadota bacterium]
MRILVVEDDERVADLIRRTMREGAWAADLASTGSAAREAVAGNEYDLIVLDLGLPDTSGIALCQEWRKQGVHTPILVLTARNALADRVEGLDAGADDYLAKPFAVEELRARLRALARRPSSALAPVLQFDDIVFDPASRTARRDGRPIPLTHREFALLEYLLRNPRRVQSRSQILEHVWDDNFEPVANSVDVLVARLRRKLEAGGAAPLIHTVRGAGYILTDEPPAHED